MLRQAGVSVLVHASGFRGADYRALVAAADAPGLRLAVELGDGWEALLAPAQRVDAADARCTRGAAHLRSADQHPVHLRHDGLAEGRDAFAPQHPLNGHMVGQMCGYGEHDRICIPVPFYHCFGMVMGNLAAVAFGACAVIPSEAFDARAVLEAIAAERCTSLYGVPTMFIAILADEERASFDVTSLRTGIMAGSPCPVEVMKRVRRRAPHARGHHLLRDDRDLAGLDADEPRRPARQAREHRRARASAPRGQGRRSRDGPRGAARHAGRAVHARLLRDARLLERRRVDAAQPSTAAATCTRATSRRWTTRAT